MAGGWAGLSPASLDETMEDFVKLKTLLGEGVLSEKIDKWGIQWGFKHQQDDILYSQAPPFPLRWGIIKSKPQT
jgi:hypothetical protein